MTQADTSGKDRWPPPLNGWALRTLREGRGWTQDDLAAEAGTSAQVISRLESGKLLTLTPERLEELVERMGYPPEALEEVLFSLARARSPRPAETWSPVDPTSQQRDHLFRGLRRAGLADLEAKLELAIRRFRARGARRAREHAARFWSRHLLACPPEKRALILDNSPSFQSWALAELLAHESAIAACDDPRSALALAELALRLAQRVTAEAAQPWRMRLLGYVRLFLANALRVGNAMAAAEVACAEGLALWEAGEDSAKLLAEWRIPDLTASLRREQRRFSEALELHRRALRLAPPAEHGRILLKKAFTFEQMTDYEDALETLAEAAPRIDAADEPRLRFGLSCNTVVALLHLGRVAEVADLLEETRGLAARLGKRLDRVRVRWLEGRAAFARGALPEAQAAFEDTRHAFADLGLPYDFALASLDLALLRRAQRRRREVQGLAAGMVTLFKQHNVPREALAAATLFEEAAREEAVTEDLVRRLQAYLAAARRNPELRFER